MTGSTKTAIGLGVLCALLAGVMIGGNLGRSSESERYFSRANRTLDAIGPVAKEAEEAERLSEKTDLTKAANDMALAAAMYANDHGGRLPSPVGFGDKASPYVNPRSARFVDRFRWSFVEGPVGSINKMNASPDEVGRIEGKTGTAVGYISGHAAWLPK